jgi:hypothetical protein
MNPDLNWSAMNNLTLPSPALPIQITEVSISACAENRSTGGGPTAYLRIDGMRVLSDLEPALPNFDA